MLSKDVENEYMFKQLIIIPVFNTSRSLPSLLSQLSSYRESVLFVDDGSQDETQDILRESAYMCIRNEGNIGVSKEIQTGLRYAKENNYTHVVTLDGDGQHDPIFLQTFIEQLLTCNLVIGNRFSDLNSLPDTKIGSNLLSLLITLEMFREFIPDVSCGYRSWRLDTHLNTELLSSYEIVFFNLFLMLRRKALISFVVIPPVYDYTQLLVTRRSELESFVSVLRRYKPGTELPFDLHTFNLLRDFRVRVKGLDFHGFYLKEYNSYHIQVEISAAVSKYNEYRR